MIGVLAPRVVERDAGSTRATGTLTARWFLTAAFLLAIALQRLIAPDSSDGADAGGSPVAQIVWALMYVIAAAGLAMNARRAGELIRRSPLLVAIVVLALVSVAWSADPLLTARRSIGLLGTTAVAYYAVSRLELNDFIDVFATVASIVAAASLFVIAAFPDVGIMQREYAGAWSGLFGHKNGFGLFLSVAVVTLMVQLARTRGWKRILAGASLLLCLIELAGSQSLTSMLATALSIYIVAMLWWASRGKYRLRWAVGCTVLGAVAVSIAALASGVIDDGTILGRNATLTGRTDIWPFVWQAVSSHWLLGFGYDVFWSDGGPYLQYLPSTIGWRPFHAHDGYLELALDLGAAGVTLALAAMSRALSGGWKLVRRRFSPSRAWPLVALIYFMLLNLTESYIAKYNNFDWIIFVAAFLYATVPTKKGAARDSRG